MKKFYILLLLLIIGCNSDKPEKLVIKDNISDPIPITQVPYFVTYEQKPGWEERGPEFTKWNSTGVRIGGGSGTLSYYDRKENYLYIISCGHLFFQGKGGADYYKKNPKSVTIDVFYHNEIKLANFKSYKAELLCHVWQNNIYDVALLRFKPDWKNPLIAPVVPKDFVLKESNWYHNVGCDGRTEVAHYLVRFFKLNIRNSVEEIICVDNVARGGRSGGGLLTSENELIGITSRSDRKSISYYSSTKQIHKFLTDEGYEFVLKGVENYARDIPIIDRNNPQGEYKEDYIPLPK